jgi:hypothetical protein
MRTTIDIPDDLFRSLKVAAADRGVTMKTLVCETLGKEFKPHSKPFYRAKFPLIRGNGKHKINLTNAEIEDIFAQEDFLA